jgi:hypothetical protein
MKGSRNLFDDGIIVWRDAIVMSYFACYANRAVDGSYADGLEGGDDVFQHEISTDFEKEMHHVEAFRFGNFSEFSQYLLKIWKDENVALRHNCSVPSLTYENKWEWTINMIGGIICDDVLWSQEKRVVLSHFVQEVMTYFLHDFEMIRRTVILYQNYK